MSLSGIKTSVRDWVSNVDISDIDWRLRWPLFILPFLLIALLYLLLRVNQLSGEHSQSSLDLALMVQNVSSSSAVSNEQAELNQLNTGLLQLQNNSAQLQQWLSQGRNLEEYAEHASFLTKTLAEQNEQSNTRQGVLPGVVFWNRFSDVLAIIESGVIAGQIKTPESRNLIEAMRLQYAELRSMQVTGPNAIAAASQPQSAGNLADTQAVGAAVRELGDQTARLSTLQNRALIVAALASLLFGLLLWGLIRNTRNMRHSNAGKERNEQSAILRLLDEITPLANGDLRVQATVSEASTGAIADAFNYAVEELRRLVHAVNDSAELVGTSVRETTESANQLARASSVQSREIHRSSNYLNVMSDTMAQLSAHAVESSRIADQSVQQAHAGNTAVQANVDALSRIRKQADSTSQLMQRLVETSASIQERVNDIQVVAKRTDLLALNATIKSSAQVSNGGSENMSMLSDDIAHLADTLGRASRDIGNLSDLIQQDATITLRSLSDTVAELDDGQRTALQASDNLHEIDRVSNELNGLINDIASKSLRQAGVVKQLSANMGVINNITRDSTLELQSSARSLKQLESITAELRDSVSDFKLPRDAANTRNPIAEKNAEQDVHQRRKAQLHSKVARPKAERSPVKHA